MYILNEREFIREILISKLKPSDISFGYLTTLIAKYYFYNCDDAKELSDLVKEKLRRFYLPSYQEYIYHAKVENICRELFETRNIAFKELEYIPIYENEIKIIDSINSIRKKKIMFTIFAVARYANCDGWINKKDSQGLMEIFKLANVNASLKQRNQMLYELYHDGYISLAKKIDNLNIHVDLYDIGEIAYKIRDFNDIGNQWSGNFREGFKQCEMCGKPVKIKSNRQRYCERCAKIAMSEHKKAWKKKEKSIRGV